MNIYAIAVQEAKQSSTSLADAISRIRNIPGVTIVDDLSDDGSDSDIVCIQATETAHREVKRLLSSSCHIEPCIPHSPQAGRSLLTRRA
jgi:hypothetical protein